MAPVARPPDGDAPPEDPWESARRYLSEDEMRAAWEEGRAMTPEEALAYVRDTSAG